MNLSELLPPTSIIFVSSLLVISRFENQRWIRARARGYRGSSEVFGLLVDLTGTISLVFSFLFLIAYGYDAGWKLALSLFLFGFILSIIYTLISGIIFGGDRVIVWIIGTLAIWPLMYVLAKKVSWFGFWL